MVTTAVDLPGLPALVTGQVAHQRLGPVTHGFRHRAYLWLVDLDKMPRPPWYLRPFAGFDARDHLGGRTPGASGSLKTNVVRFLRLRDIDLGTRPRVVMLANARVLGHVFDPLTVYWCFTGDGSLRCIVTEVHNTYGERHAYLLEPDEHGTATVDKEFYVSPFNDLSGHYVLRFCLTPDRVSTQVQLVRQGATVFEASFEGVPAAATPGRIARTAARLPVMPQRVSALIRVHGIWMWLRRLPVVKRPTHHAQEGV